FFRSGQYDKLTIHGPKPSVRVVGVIRTRLDLVHVSYAGKYFLATPAFHRAYGDIFSFGPQLDVLLTNHGGASRFVNAAHTTEEEKYPESATSFSARTTKSSLTSIRDATRVQALSLGLVAGAA